MRKEVPRSDEYFVRRNPEKKLLAAILARALHDCLSPYEHEYGPARDWVGSEDKGAWTRKWIMEHLDLNPDLNLLEMVMDENDEKIRERIKELRIVK